MARKPKTCNKCKFWAINEDAQGRPIKFGFCKVCKKWRNEFYLCDQVRGKHGAISSKKTK